jgi:hypothetical protein
VKAGSGKACARITLTINAYSFISFQEAASGAPVTRNPSSDPGYMQFLAHALVDARPHSIRVNGRRQDLNVPLLSAYGITRRFYWTFAYAH